MVEASLCKRDAVGSSPTVGSKTNINNHEVQLDYYRTNI